MHAFLVELENKPGALAGLAEAIAAKGINITNVSGSSLGTGGRVALMTADDATTRSVLQDQGLTFTEREIAETSLRDEPGMLAGAARRLADAGVNIEAIFAMGMSGGNVSVGFVTDDPAKAREALGP